jgi:hypothetical protein
MPPQDAPQPNSPSPFKGAWRVPQEPDGEGRVRSAFAAIASDPWFWVVARFIPPQGIGKELNQLKSQYPNLATFLSEFANVDFRYAYWDQGGWANFDEPPPRRVVLALSHWSLLPMWRAATASHELLHFARYVQGITPFGVRPPWYRRWWEELKLFAFGVVYAPLSWLALLMLPLAPALLLFGIMALVALLR